VSALSKHVAQIEAQFGTDVAVAWRKYHIAAQLTRLAAGVMTSVLWAVMHAGVTDWTSVVPVAVAAFWATLAQMWPQVPWSLIRDRLHAGAPPTSPGPPA
jgi:hypothetical protein